MRFDTAIYFVKAGAKTYDPTSGNYTAAEPEKTLIYGDMNDTQAEMLQIIYGKIVQGSYTVRILGSYTDLYDYIEIGGKRYNVDYFRRFRRYEAFYVREAQ